MNHIVLFATLLIFAGTACKKPKEITNAWFLYGKWEEELSSRHPRPVYTLNSDRSYTLFPGGTATEENGTYRILTTRTPNILELRFTKADTTLPYPGYLRTYSDKLIGITINNKERIFSRMP